MCVVLYQGSKICGCYVLMFGKRIVIKKIQKYKNFVGPLVIRLRYLLRTMPGGGNHFIQILYLSSLKYAHLDIFQ